MLTPTTLIPLALALTAFQPPPAGPESPREPIPGDTLPTAPGPATPRNPARQAPAQPAASAAGRYKGTIVVDPSNKLEFSLVIIDAIDGGKPSGTMSIPAQNFKDGRLKDLKVSDTALSFILPIAGAPEGVWPSFELAMELDGVNFKGTMKQNGQSFGVLLKRALADEQLGPSRPQTPKPPFPYSIRPVIFTNPADKARLAGTLTFPRPAEGAAPVGSPCVVLLTGSGPQDRDETLFEHKPFAVIADYLTRRGIAVLRFDDRGVGGSTAPKRGEETTDDFAADAVAAVQFLKTQPEIDATKIGILGHSEGGVSGPMAATLSDDIAFVVMLAGTGVSGREILEAQLVEMMKAQGVPPERIKPVSDLQKQFLAIVAGYDKLDEPGVMKAQEELKSVARKLILAQSGANADDPAMTVEQKQALDSAAAREAKTYTGAWMRRFVNLDPREALRKLKVPVLVLNGSRDTQVPASLNVPEIQKALKDGGNTDVTTRVFDGLNHMFQPCTTGGADEYGVIETTIDSKVLEEIATFIRARTGLAEPAPKPVPDANPAK